MLSRELAPGINLYFCSWCGNSSTNKEEIKQCEAAGGEALSTPNPGMPVQIYRKVFQSGRSLISSAPEWWTVTSLRYTNPNYMHQGGYLTLPAHTLLIRLDQNPSPNLQIIRHLTQRDLWLWMEGDEQKLRAAQLLR